MKNVYAECGGPTWRLAARTHKGRNNDGKRQAQESSNFDHGLQDERGSGTVQMRNGEWGAYSALIPALRRSVGRPAAFSARSPESFRGRRRWSAGAAHGDYWRWRNAGND